MTDDNRKPVDGWTPGEYGGYSRKNTDLDFDGEGLEVCESVSGYEGYTSRTYISLELLNAVLAEKGMTVVESRNTEILQERVRQLEETLRSIRAVLAFRIDKDHTAEDALFLITEAIDA